MQFYQDQGVEVFDKLQKRWLSATIRTRKAIMVGGNLIDTSEYQVEFRDNSLGVFDTEHIRAINPAKEYPGLAEPDDDTSDPRTI